MCVKFEICSNNFLKTDTVGYYHQIYTGYGNPDNPTFLNTLKNTFNSEPDANLYSARDKVIQILCSDIPQIVSENNMQNCMLVCIPRAKSLARYSAKQLMLKEAVSVAANNINNITDGTDCVVRIENTQTTHLSRATNIPNDGKPPYPGITVDTCIIVKKKILNQNIILVDDIYTKGVNIDEDCIQALLENGANKVIFYSIGYTRRFQ